jgi:hypothetical protein
MTESEWDDAPDPYRMMQHMDQKVSDRKLRLFACACCRRIWDLIEGELQRRAVELAERFADGTGHVIGWEKGEDNGPPLRFRRMLRGPDEGAESSEREALMRELEEESKSLTEEAYNCRYEQITPEATAEWTLAVRCDVPSAVAYCASRLKAAPTHYWKRAFHDPNPLDWDAGLFRRKVEAEMSAQAIILRDIIGNPFRPATIDPAWLTPGVIVLARHIYDERAFGGMPGLGDALEEAGCDSADILSHCRSGTEHVPGCWVVDAILGKS